MYLQKVHNWTPSAFDQERKYVNEIESIPWNYY